MSCPVELCGEDEPILVLGQCSAGITGVAYRAAGGTVRCLPGWPDATTTEQGGRIEDGWRALQYLEKSDPVKTEAQVIVSDLAGWGKRRRCTALPLTAPSGGGW